MQLSEVPIHQIKAGLRVTGSNGRRGKVTSVNWEKGRDTARFHEVVIMWDELDYPSIVFHQECKNIAVDDAAEVARKTAAAR
jgi:hypothetical protein